MRIKILYIRCPTLAALCAAEIPELVFETSFDFFLYIYETTANLVAGFESFRGFLYGKKTFIWVFEGVECDFDNNFSVWIRFKKCQFFDGFWPRKTCQKLKKS